MRHGTHHDAQKSTYTTLPRRLESARVRDGASRRGPETSGTGAPASTANTDCAQVQDERRGDAAHQKGCLSICLATCVPFTVIVRLAWSLVREFDRRGPDVRGGAAGERLVHRGAADTIDRAAEVGRTVPRPSGNHVPHRHVAGRVGEHHAEEHTGAVLDDVEAPSRFARVPPEVRIVELRHGRRRRWRRRRWRRRRRSERRDVGGDVGEIRRRIQAPEKGHLRHEAVDGLRDEPRIVGRELGPARRRQTVAGDARLVIERRAVGDVLRVGCARRENDRRGERPSGTLEKYHWGFLRSGLMATRP